MENDPTNRGGNLPHQSFQHFAQVLGFDTLLSCGGLDAVSWCRLWPVYVWRCPKSWGYPYVIIHVTLLFSINHPASLGYHHDYGTPHEYIILGCAVADEDDHGWMGPIFLKLPWLPVHFFLMRHRSIRWYGCSMETQSDSPHQNDRTTVTADSR